MFKKKRIIDEILKDLSPDVREAAKSYLETLSIDELMSSREVMRKLREKGFIRDK